VSRRRAKLLAIVGTALTGLIAGASVASIWFDASWLILFKGGSSTAALWLGRGCLGGWLATGVFVDPGGRGMDALYGPHVRPVSDPAHWLLQRGAPGGAQSIEIPLWLPLLMTAVPTVFLIRAALRPGPGRCKVCGYDLTGVRGLVCPECGEEFNR